MAYTLPQVFQMRKDVQTEYNKQPPAARDAWLRQWWEQYGKREAVDMWNRDNAKPFENKPPVNESFVQNQDNMQNAGSYQENTNTPSTPDTGDKQTGNTAMDKAIEELKSINDSNAQSLALALKEISIYKDKLAQMGKMINPDITIGEEEMAKFLTQAQKEISPYYNDQLKIAREGLLRKAGYTSDEIESQEAELERKYGRTLQNVGETQAEAGMALSGRRQLEEQNLAEDTQRTIDENRKRAEFEMGNTARAFAGEWGSEDLTPFSYSSAPKVSAGINKFSRSLDTKPFYNISDSVYQGIKGSRDYEMDTAVKQRQSELEKSRRTILENEERKRLLTI